MASARTSSGVSLHWVGPGDEASDDGEAEFARLVMDLSLRKYGTLPKKGKPKRGEEWTPLATILCRQGTLLFLNDITVCCACYLLYSAHRQV